MKAPLLLSALALSLAACSPKAGDNGSDSVVTNNNSAMTEPPVMPAPVPANVLTLEGLGNLKIGAPVPPDSGWAERGAQISETCRTVTSPDHPGVYAIIEDGVVRRISVGQRSDVKLIEGIGVGASEQQVRDAFPGFRDEPHKYVDSPAKYLTAPNAESGDPALRFEIGEDSKISLIHVGTVPVLRYVEGCA
ncbi:MAG: hypothetical protein AB7G25_09425 [Sphingomonadaceae bacterium]